jgi:hypothetical protein
MRCSMVISSGISAPMSTPISAASTTISGV